VEHPAGALFFSTAFLAKVIGLRIEGGARRGGRDRVTARRVLHSSSHSEIGFAGTGNA
jgi:hypothetical protein